MKKTLLLATIALFYTTLAQAQPTTATPAKDSGYIFTVDKELKCTPVKNQSRTGTCWCFATTAFFESELLRTGKGEYDLSEMYVVRRNYERKADRYVRMQGKISFSPGAISVNVFDLVRNYGLMPESAYSGLNYGDTLHNHSELDALARAYVDAVVKSKKLTTAWMNGYKGVLDAYLGKLPESFSYKGKSYTSQTFAQELGLNMNDYVAITSFTHHPFYTQFILEIPDNYFWGTMYNLPLDELMATIDNALNTGYTVVWDADVSEEGFQHGKGYAIVPDATKTSLSGTDRARFEGTAADKNASTTFTIPKEKTITQELRQRSFDNYETTDDHLMLLTGTAHDQAGNRYYKVKNSWGTERNSYGGYLFASIPYVQYKTVSIFLHKNAIPAAMASKLGIKQ